MINNIALIPSYQDHFRNQIFEKDFENDGLAPFANLKEKLSIIGKSINTIDLVSNYNEIDLLIVMRHENNINKIFDVISKNKSVKILYISTEEISVAPTQKKELLDFGLFDRILTWRDNDLDSKLFYKFFYMTPHRSYIKNVKDKRQLACLINSYKINYFNSKDNIYSERLKVIDFFEDKKQFSLYGHNWRNYSKNLINYKGSVGKKIDTYINYDFSFIFENSNNELGGISEKIWDSLAAGCIPIYYGAPNISKYIPNICYVDYRNFENLQLLYNYLLEMTSEEKNNRRQAIEEFFQTENYELFTSNGFYKTILFHINEMTKMDPIRKVIYKIKFKILKKLITLNTPIWKHKRFYFNIIFSKYF